MAIKFGTEKEFQPGRGYSKEDWDAVDSPPLTKEEISSLRPFKEVFPEISKEMEKEIASRGRPRLEKPKTPVTIRLDQDVVDRFKAAGKGWQGRMNEALRKAVGL